MDEDSKGYLTEEETAVGLGAINPNLRDSDMVYLFRVSLSPIHSDMVYLFRVSLSQLDSDVVYLCRVSLSQLHSNMVYN